MLFNIPMPVQTQTPPDFMRFLSFLSLTVSLSFLTTSCAWIDEVGKDESKAELRLSSATESELSDRLSCPADQFPIQFYYFDADEPFDGSARIRMYYAINESLRTNSLSLIFSSTNAETLETCPAPSEISGQTLEISPNGCVRASVQFNACKEKVTAQLKGTLKMEDFSTDRGERVEGSIQGELIYIEKIQSSTETLEKSTPLGTVEGEFSFVNKQGSIWRK